MVSWRALWHTRCYLCTLVAYGASTFYPTKVWDVGSANGYKKTFAYKRITSVFCALLPCFPRQRPRAQPRISTVALNFPLLVLTVCHIADIFHVVT